jgi:hypothetical protein
VSRASPNTTGPHLQAAGQLQLPDRDLRRDGRIEFGEALPDADFYVAAARDFERYAKELDDAARDSKPSASDALTALVVMTGRC